MVKKTLIAVSSAENKFWLRIKGIDILILILTCFFHILVISLQGYLVIEFIK